MTGGKCWDGDVSLANYLGCYATESAAAQRQCYFTRCVQLAERAHGPCPDQLDHAAVRRQKAICMGADGRYGRYQGLFEAPSGDDLEAQYKAIAGDSFTSLPPTFASLFNSIEQSTLSADSQAAKDICDDSIYESMDLDQIIIAW